MSIRSQAAELLDAQPQRRRFLGGRAAGLEVTVGLLEDRLGLGERGVVDLGLGREGARVGLAADSLERRVTLAVGDRVISRRDSGVQAGETVLGAGDHAERVV